MKKKTLDVLCCWCIIDKMNNSYIRSPLKWAGGKYKLLDFLFDNISLKQRYIEPFTGAATVALNVCSTNIIINDLNCDLIAFWRHLACDVDALLIEARKLFVPENNQHKQYYELRNEFNLSATSVRKSALFFYLNKHCFNGLCRYNSSGHFNTSAGKYKTVFLDEQLLRHCSAKIKSWNIYNHDFEKIFEMVGQNDTVYCDPPYFPLSATSNFTEYAGNVFGYEQQKRLAELAYAASVRGALVAISNHDTVDSRKLYESFGASIKQIDVQRNLAGDARCRKKTSELLAIFK